MRSASRSSSSLLVLAVALAVREIGRRMVIGAGVRVPASRNGVPRIAALITVAGVVAVGAAACTAVELSPEERAREIAERWVDASRTGDEESAQALSCGPILGGVNSDLPELKSYSLEVEPQEDGQFIVEVTESFSDYPDLVTRLGVRTDGDACISWVR